MTDDRRVRMESFVAWCAAHVSGDEKGEAQTFLDRLFVAYGHAGAKEAGATFENRVKRSGRAGTGFADLVWEDTVLIEMKKRGEPLEKHTQQMLDYWVGLAGHRPAYCILCNFDEFRIFDFNKDILKPVDSLTLDKLPDRYDVLAFLFPTREEPVFGDDHEAVTREAADHLAAVFRSLVARGTERSQAQRFVLQILVALFAEDIELLAKNFVLKLLDECDTPAKSFDLLDGLFKAMNTKGGVTGGRYKGVKYFNGGLFAESAAIELNKDEIKHLRKAAEKDWSKVRPEIFGTIFEHSLDKTERHAFGAHFTSQLDILKIVKPTITDPWEELIERTARGKQPLANLNKLHQRLQNYRVLDPACGSGNFLYLAYRELKRIEAKLIEAIQDASKEKTPMFGRVTARQFYGLDINPFAVELAKVTLMIARKLAIDELHIEEPALPLDNLDDNFRTTDALITFPEDGSDPFRTEWPKVDVIIGNPPFLGAKRLKPEHGPDYVNAVRDLYPEVPGMADYCVYWIRRAHDHLPVCIPADPIAGRAGLVGTQNIRNNKSREGGLDHVVASGVIVEAVDNQPWSGEAKVHVSIANWVKTPDREGAGDALLVPAGRRLWIEAGPQSKDKSLPRVSLGRRRHSVRDKQFRQVYREAKSISAALSDKTDVTGAKELRANQYPQISFNGQMLGHDGFLLSEAEAKSLLENDPSSREIIFSYLNGREFLTASGSPSRFVLDFGMRDHLEAKHFNAAYDWVQSKVLPDREKNAKKGQSADGATRSHHAAFLRYWWRLSFCRPELCEKIAGVKRYIACSLVTKRAVFVFVESSIRPSNLLQVFTLDDDYSFGIMQSGVHWKWFRERSSKLKSDYRFGESVWTTFPWPQSPSNGQVFEVAEAGRVIRSIRDEHLPKMTGGLRSLYRTLELPGKNPLNEAHAALDAAVMKAYGFNPKEELLEQLLDLNLEVAAREAEGEPVTAPGIPPSFAETGGDPASLITDDCIRPPKL